MVKAALAKQMEQNTSRRTIVKTGAKLGYAIPIIAASFKLTSSGALAAVDCREGFVLITETEPDQCCKCDQVLGEPAQTPVVVGGLVVCYDPFTNEPAAATCNGELGVSPI